MPFFNGLSSYGARLRTKCVESIQKCLIDGKKCVLKVIDSL
jgi:hypothetical protein